MIALLVLTGPATYLLRVAGLLLARTRLVPRQMASRLALVSPAVLAALVAPSLVRPDGVLAVNPLDNPRLLVALLVLPLLIRLRRRVQVLLLVTPLAGMGLLWALLWFPHLSLTLPLVLLLLASAGLVFVVGRPLVRLLHLSSAARPGRPTLAAPAVTVTPVADQPLPAEALGLLAQPPAGVHLHCPWCACPLPLWAFYCGRCGLPQPAPALAVTQPLPVVTRRPARNECPPALAGSKG